MVRALMLLRLSTLATGRTGVRVETAPGLRRAARRRHHARSCTSTAPSAAPATSPRCRTSRWPLMGEGEVRDADGELRARRGGAARARHRAGRARREGGPRAHQRHRRHARACWCSRWPTCAGCCATADVAAAMSVEALLGTDAVFAADLQALRPHPGQAASAANLRALLAGSGDHGQPPRPRVHPRAGRLLAALRAAGARRRPRHPRPRRRGRRPRAGRRRSTTRWSPLDGRVESNGNFHGAPVGYVLDFLAIAVADVASDERAPHRPLPRRRPQPRPAAVPRRRPGRRLRAT